MGGDRSTRDPPSFEQANDWTATSNEAPGVRQLQAIARPSADPSEVAAVFAAFPGDYPQMIDLLQRTSGNAFTQRVLAQLSGGSASPAAKSIDLPGQMITATLFDAQHKTIATRTDPLYDHHEVEVLFGRVQGNAISWDDGSTPVTVNVRLGAKLDPKGHLVGGVPIEAWARDAGKGRASFVMVEIEGAMSKTADHVGRDGGSERTSHPTGSSHGGKDANTSSGSDGNGSMHAGAAGSGHDVRSQSGATPNPGHSGTGTSTQKGKARGEHGDTTRDLHGRPAGSVDGSRDDDVGMLHDADLTGGGHEDFKHPDESAHGMAGGEGDKKDKGVAGAGAWIGIIEVPSNLKPAVSMGAILLTADITGVADDLVKVALEFGTKDGRFAMFAIARMNRYVDSEMETIANGLNSEPSFAAKSASEQKAILDEARRALVKDARANITRELDRRAAQADKLAAEETASGNEYAMAAAEDDRKLASAARDAKDTVESDAATVSRNQPTAQLPQGVTRQQFESAGKLIREKIADIHGSVAVHGSRAAGTARAASDIDFAIRVGKDEFDRLVQKRFGTPNPGSAKLRTMEHAIKTGKIQAGEAGLRALRVELEKVLGMDVDISIVLIGGAFDTPPFIPVPT